MNVNADPCPQCDVIFLNEDAALTHVDPPRTCPQCHQHVHVFTVFSHLYCMRCSYRWT